MNSVSQIKVITCGSVDDGKSTLVGRILSETNNILTDQEAKLKVISKRYGTTKDPLDYALLILLPDQLKYYLFRKEFYQLKWIFHHQHFRM